MRGKPGDSQAQILSQQLLLSLAEHLKVPLQQLARQAEVGQLNGVADLTAMQHTADSALRLLDSYALGVRLSLETNSFEVEPVSVSSVLYDTGQELTAMAKAYGVGLELHVAGRYAPVMAHRQGLQSALTSLGMALIEALPALESPQLTLQLATHKCRYGIVAGLYADTEQLTHNLLEQGRQLHGKTRQPLAGFSHASGAGVFMADAILRAMHLQLGTSRHNKLFGLSTILQPNQQLQLV